MEIKIWKHSGGSQEQLIILMMQNMQDSSNESEEKYLCLHDVLFSETFSFP